VTHIATDTTIMGENVPPSYTVKLKLSAEEITKLGSNKLKPGMAAEAYIQTNARTPFSYFVKPFMDNVARSFNEE
jgi:HlyD family secretion protein